MDNILKQTLEQALKDLFDNEPTLYEYTDQSSEREWNLAHHYAIALSKYFPELDCDVEIAKTEFNNERPDIIFHKRGNHENNFLVIEVKRDKSSLNFDDIEKIQKHWFKGELKYKFGSVVTICKDLSRCQVKVFTNLTR